MQESIGKRIASARKAKGMTQVDLAGKMGVSSQAVSKWETDASCPDISLLPLLCKTLGITADELLTGKSDTVRMVPQQERRSLEEMTMRVNVLSSAGDKVRVNLPMSAVKICMEIGMEIGPGFMGENGEALKGIDMQKVVQLVESGLIGKLVEVESAQGDKVEIVVE